MRKNILIALYNRATQDGAAAAAKIFLEATQPTKEEAFAESLAEGQFNVLGEPEEWEGLTFPTDPTSLARWTDGEPTPPAVVVQDELTERPKRPRRESPIVKELREEDEAQANWYRSMRNAEFNTNESQNEPDNANGSGHLESSQQLTQNEPGSQIVS